MPSIRNLQPATNDYKLWFISCFNSCKIAFYSSPVRILEIKGYVDYFNNKCNYGHNNSEHSAQNVVSPPHKLIVSCSAKIYVHSNKVWSLIGRKVREINKNVSDSQDLYLLIRCLGLSPTDCDQEEITKSFPNYFFKLTVLHSVTCCTKLAACPCNQDLTLLQCNWERSKTRLFYVPKIPRYNYLGLNQLWLARSTVIQN